jgi:hypothetical protein
VKLRRHVTVRHTTFPAAVCGLATAMAIGVMPVAISAIRSPLDRADMQRALNLARWPRTDADRARFHAAYILPIDGPTIDAWTVEQVEILTEFRRLELMAEDHVRLNDTWARAGLREAEEAMRPWKGLLSVRARLGLRSTRPYVGHVPPAEIRIEGAEARGDPARTDLYANCAGDTLGCAVVGGLVEQAFEASSVAHAPARGPARWDARELAGTVVDRAARE